MGLTKLYLDFLSARLHGIIVGTEVYIRMKTRHFTSFIEAFIVECQKKLTVLESQVTILSV